MICLQSLSTLLFRCDAILLLLFFLNQRKREGTCSFFIPKEWLKVPNNALIAIDGRPFNCQGNYMPITPTPLNHFMLHGVEANGWPT
jgi:hypothetical protein